MAVSIVLVHGAWHGAWCWDPVVDILTERGQPVVALDLPGHGADTAPLTDLHGHGDAVRTALDALDTPAILVGHSYGGAAITDAGTHDAVRHLVYISAFPIDTHETMIVNDATGGDENALQRAIRVDGDTLTIDPDAAVDAFFHDCDEADAARAVAQLTAERMDGFGQSPRVAAWRERPSTYAVCTDDRAVTPALQRDLAARCTTTVEWPTSHSPFLSQPALVADCLIELARSTAQ
ncbi:MAG: alpha/beta hydrolase [Acidimicrobiia bacterium]|nr:alpha/beta hydrolase [Acidimicrobiia bacterium]